VDSREAKWLAEEVTRAVPGVQDVHNRLKVARW
jgi:osmotically-inducible protein OsmY